MAGIIKVNQYQDFNGNTLFTSDGNGNLTAQNLMYPAFEVYLSASQALTDDTNTKIQWDTKVFDTDSIYNTTDYKATIPSGKGGKYLIYAHGQARGDGTTLEVLDSQLRIHKNGTGLTRTTFAPDTNTTAERNCFVTVTKVEPLVAGDYIEIFALINSVSGTTSFVAEQSGQITSRFGMFRIGS